MELKEKGKTVAGSYLLDASKTNGRVNLRPEMVRQKFMSKYSTKKLSATTLPSLWFSF